MNYLIDYFAFTLKPDLKNPLCPSLSLFDFVSILGLSDIFSNFSKIGGHLHYEQTYKYHQIEIFEPNQKQVGNMGYMFQLTGQGCREFESMFNDFTWNKFFQHIFSYVEKGFLLNICRIDFAYDDYDGLLDLPTIWDCAVKRDFVSVFRSVPSLDVSAETTEIKLPSAEITPPSLHLSSYQFREGATINYGNRKSNTFCKFYDKKIEQLVKHKNDPEAIKKLENISHWVRFEITFKREVANKVLLSMISLSEYDFCEFMSRVINGYIRFIDRDDTNVTRCTVKTWWSDFIGTVLHSRLTHRPLKINVLRRSLDWLNSSLSPTLCALIRNLGKDNFFKMCFESGDVTSSRWKQKHYELLETKDIEDDNMIITSADYWRSLVPKSLSELISSDVDKLLGIPDLSEFVDLQDDSDFFDDFELILD